MELMTLDRAFEILEAIRWREFEGSSEERDKAFQVAMDAIGELQVLKEQLRIWAEKFNKKQEY